MLDTLEILDTSDNTIILICSFSDGEVYTPLTIDEIPEWFKIGLPNLYQLINLTRQN